MLLDLVAPPCGHCLEDWTGSEDCWQPNSVFRVGFWGGVQDGASDVASVPTRSLLLLPRSTCLRTLHNSRTLPVCDKFTRSLSKSGRKLHPALGPANSGPCSSRPRRGTSCASRGAPGRALSNGTMLAIQSGENESFRDRAHAPQFFTVAHLTTRQPVIPHDHAGMLGRVEEQPGQVEDRAETALCEICHKPRPLCSSRETC